MNEPKWEVYEIMGYRILSVEINGMVFSWPVEVTPQIVTMRGLFNAYSFPANSTKEKVQ